MKIKYNNNIYKLFSKEQHIKKHTKKENTYCDDCLFCNFSEYEAKQIMKKFKQEGE
jgi:bisphosphoglycerate-independent phosphoglycerate mutase (AlkP superfamily)